MFSKILPLEKGEIIDVICPASKEKPNFRNALDQACTKHGFTFRMLNENDPNEPFSSANDETRWNYLKQALENPDSKVIYARGGYGVTRLLKYLENYTPPIKKILIGFSDVTALHIWFNQKYDWQTIHGQLAKETNTKENQESADFVFDFLKQVKPITYKGFEPLNDLANKDQTINSKLGGGNLCLVQNSLGTNWQVDFIDKIVFLEDTNEQGYKIDRVLEQLNQAKVFAGAKAVIFGDFDGLPTEEEQNLTDVALKRFAQSSQIPVFKATGFGHSAYNHPLLFNSSVVLEVNNGTGELSL
jgi:muramoyltetrapeptide carboxypeptidase